jgi:CheY-specific phosphatase CheX
VISSQPFSNPNGDMGDRLLALLPEIMAEVAEQVYFADAEPAAAGRFADELTTPAAWLHARVAFHGIVAGSIEILLPRDLVSEIGIAALGGASDAPLTNQQMRDVAGEMANMVCGALLTRTNRDQQFDLLPPQVASVMNIHRGADETTSNLLFSMNDRPVVVRCRICRA